MDRYLLDLLGVVESLMEYMGVQEILLLLGEVFHFGHYPFSLWSLTNVWPSCKYRHPFHPQLVASFKMALVNFFVDLHLGWGILITLRGPFFGGKL